MIRLLEADKARDSGGLTRLLDALRRAESHTPRIVCALTASARFRMSGQNVMAHYFLQHYWLPQRNAAATVIFGPNLLQAHRP